MMHLPPFEIIDEAYAAILAKKTPMEKVAMINSAYRTAQALVTAGVKYRHPDWNELQITNEVKRIMNHGST